jgi:integrase
VHYKYEQVWKHLTQCDPTVSLETLDKDKMLELKDWYVKNNYKNRTITKQFRFLKSFLRWMKANGYPVHESAIDCQIHLTVTKKNVTFLTFKELMQFYHYKFAPEHKYLDKARDMFCFMAFTSLRYSDLAQLKRANITSRGIELYTKKTSTPITIPIIDYAQEIIDKYSSYKSSDGSLFPVPSSQKLNDYIKLAAEQAGIDREVVNTYFIGTKRYDEVHKFYEIIGCHDGRRTFVCCSLAFGIPPAVVMSCTGHKDYQSMKPYIEVGNDTQKLELGKWNGKDTKVDIIAALEELDADKLEQVYDFVKSIAS